MGFQLSFPFLAETDAKRRESCGEYRMQKRCSVTATNGIAVAAGACVNHFYHHTSVTYLPSARLRRVVALYRLEIVTVLNSTSLVSVPAPNE